MKVTIKDFGPIKKYEIDLNKRFIVNYGPNGIGKSFAMNVVYLMIKNLYHIVTPYPLLMLSVEEFNAHPIFRDTRQSFEATFGRGSPSNKRSGKEFEIVLESQSPHFYAVFGERDGELRLIEAAYDYLSSGGQSYAEALAFFSKCFGKHLSPYFIPASRLGLYQGFIKALGPVIADISQIRGLLKNPFMPIPHLPVPVADYIAALSYKNPIVSADPFRQIITKIAEDIESEILKGAIRFDEMDHSFYYKPSGMKEEIGVEYASSMVGELAPLVRIIKNSLNFSVESLFYEEPEAHLHPEQQTALAEKLVRLSELGLNAVISTHSNFMFNKFNNLILGGRLSGEDYMPILMEPTQEGSVSRVMGMSELGVLDENFSKVADKLQAEREEIMKNRNAGQES